MRNGCFIIVMTMGLAMFGVPLRAQLKVSLYGQDFRFQVPEAGVLVKDVQGINYTTFHEVAKSAVQKLMPLGEAIAKASDEKQFNDWLTIKLTAEVVSKGWKKSADRTLAMMALLRAMNYNAGIIVVGGEWKVAFEINQKVLFATMFESDGRRYSLYDIKKKGLEFKTGPSDNFYNANLYLEKAGPINLDQVGFPNLPLRSKMRTIKWTYGGEAFKITFAINKNFAQYLAERPQVDVETYFNELLSKEAQEGVIEPLRKIIQDRGWSGRKATEFLLDFCSQGFTYKEDIATVEGEHANSVDETLLSTHSDCEDRAVLFSAIVKSILGYETIGIEYPNHITVGVKLPVSQLSEDRSDEQYIVEGSAYTNCDASILGGTVGDANPRYKGRNPDRVFKVGKPQLGARNEDKP
jgi:hypothetical protein